MNWKELQIIIAEEKNLYIHGSQLHMFFVQHKRYLIWKCLRYYRISMFFNNKMQDRQAFRVVRFLCRILWLYFWRASNRKGIRSNVEISHGSVIGRNCDIWHGGVIINGTLGDNVLLHGNNVIGNKGKGKESRCPMIGDCVDIGAGSVIIGDVTIADHCSIGANAVVVKSCFNKYAVLVGIPAQELNVL